MVGAVGHRTAASAGELDTVGGKQEHRNKLNANSCDTVGFGLLVLLESAAFSVVSFSFYYALQRAMLPQRARRENCARPSPRTAFAGHDCMPEQVAERFSRYGSYARGCHNPELACMQMGRKKTC